MNDHRRLQAFYYHFSVLIVCGYHFNTKIITNIGGKEKQWPIQSKEMCVVCLGIKRTQKTFKRNHKTTEEISSDFSSSKNSGCSVCFKKIELQMC